MANPHPPTFKPLIPLPSDSPKPPKTPPLPVATNLVPEPPASPFSALFDPPPSASSSKPLFSGPVGRPARPALHQQPPPLPPPTDESPTSAFGEFVSFDPLSSRSQLAPAEAPPPQHQRKFSDAEEWNFVSASTASFGKAATARNQARSEKVMGELVGRDDDPLGWLSGAPATTSGTEPFDDWDGMEDAVDSVEKEQEMQEEIRDRDHQPGTPHASPSSLPIPLGGHRNPYHDESDGEEDILDLKTGKRERGRPMAKPIPIVRHHAPPPAPSHSYTSTASSYLFGTLPKKWFSSASTSPAADGRGSSPGVPRAGITRQNSSGEFTTLPPPDLGSHYHYGGSGGGDKSSPRPPLSTIFDTAPTPSTPFAKKVFIPATGAPAFVPEENWNPSGFEYDKHSKKDTMGSVKLNLVGRSIGTIPVLSQEVADSLRPHLPALPRLSKNWSLLYSTDQHGMSISTLYKNVERFYGVSGCVLAVREASDDDDSGDDGRCFGVYLGGGMKCNGEAYYGSGESFLWKGDRSSGAKVFKWTGRNDYVALCEPSYLSFGGGDGKYGLYVDSSFVDGTSERCDTFANETLCNTVSDVNGRARFECLALEVWRVGP